MTKKKAKTKRLAPITRAKTVEGVKLNDQLLLRFAQNYISCCDPTRSAVSSGIGVNPKTREIDYDLAERVGKKLVTHKTVLAHVSYLNDKYHPDLKLDYEAFMGLIGEMSIVSFGDYFQVVGGEDVLKPLYMLTKAEQMCLASVDTYMYEQEKQGTSKRATKISLKLIDKTKVLEMYARVAGFYNRTEGLSDEEATRKLRAAMASMEAADGALM